ncbi:MAG: TetR family transcriptional regulator C-terminal domain-containing protein [Flavobacteriaceae bacterium]|nr:TetR family transcriptional regulator C-terminal domain-containing protein [Flavobacteriaceae bacterium]
MNKTLDKKEIINQFMQITLESGKSPDSIFKFCQELSIEEKEFYKYFNSFKDINKAVFTSFFEQTIKILEKSKEYEDFSPRDKMLSFYFTFFEFLTSNRSFVLLLLQNKSLKNLSFFVDLRKHFGKFITDLELEIIDFKSEKLDKIQLGFQKESAWAQFMFILKYWMEDSSPAFEKTDVLIEKSVHAYFDLSNTKPLRSVMDLGKFLFKEKMMFH